MIEITNVGMSYPVPKRYMDYLLKPFEKERFTALSQINITIEQGDKVAFLGANGAGKTTLLKLIGGILYPTEGTIRINGMETVKQNKSARKSIGFVLNEERSFYWRLTGYENLMFFGTLDNIPKVELQRRINELLTLVDLEYAANKRVSSYSSGMKQRLAIARGLLAEPDILILDEPTRTLDPIAAEEVKELIFQRIHAVKKRTLLIATHSLGEAESLCNKVIAMKAGKMLAYDTMPRVLEKHGALNTFYNKVMRDLKRGNTAL